MKPRVSAKETHDIDENMGCLHLCRHPLVNQLARDLLYLNDKVHDEDHVPYRLAELTPSQHESFGLRVCGLCAFAMCRSPDGRTACGMERGCLCLGRLRFFIRNTRAYKREIRVILHKAYVAITHPLSPTLKTSEDNGTDNR